MALALATARFYCMNVGHRSEALTGPHPCGRGPGVGWRNIAYHSLTRPRDFERYRLFTTDTSGLPVNLPTSKASTIEVQKVSVTVTKDLQYFVNDKKVTRNTLEAELKRSILSPKGVVVLHIDRSVPTEELVYVAGIATSLEARVTIATKPK